MREGGEAAAGQEGKLQQDRPIRHSLCLAPCWAGHRCVGGEEQGGLHGAVGAGVQGKLQEDNVRGTLGLKQVCDSAG